MHTSLMVKHSMLPIITSAPRLFEVLLSTVLPAPCPARS
jgi:hypothetical protein